MRVATDGDLLDVRRSVRFMKAQLSRELIAMKLGVSPTRINGLFSELHGECSESGSLRAMRSQDSWNCVDAPQAGTKRVTAPRSGTIPGAPNSGSARPTDGRVRRCGNLRSTHRTAAPRSSGARVRDPQQPG